MKNIVFILMDQLRADFLGCYGATHLLTPNIDDIACKGTRYEQAISPSPLCVPARAAMMTGRSSIANRVTENGSWLRPDHEAMGVLTWPKQLSDKGYHTCAIGKMHFYPWDINEGFDDRIIAEDKRHINIKDDYEDYLEEHGYRRMHGEEFEGYFEHQGAYVNTLPDEMQIDRFVADRTCDTIKVLDKDKPFALMVGFPGPHCPYDPTQRMLDDMPTSDMPEPIPATAESKTFRPLFIRNNKYDWNKVDYTEFTRDSKMRIRKHYSALITEIDNHVGKIIDSLKERGLYDDTVIVISSDHGDMMGDYDLLSKHFFFETSIRVPLIIKHPEVSTGVVEEAVSITDLYSTLLNFGGIDVKDTVDSTFLKPFGADEARAPIFGATDIGWMIRESRYKYCICNNGTEMMFDLKEDPTEQNNLIHDVSQNEKKESMKKLLYKRMFEGIEEANNDQVVMIPNLDKGFYDRNWTRPYPNKY